MSSATLERSPAVEETRKAAVIDMKLEVVVIPVADVERAKQFYLSIGWRLDADFADGDNWRVLQVTPRGSACSFFIGKGLTKATPGSLQGLMLVVDDIEAARADLIQRGVDVSDAFHFEHNKFHFTGTHGRLPGPDPEGRSYFTLASFNDPDGNGWLLQQVTARFPGRIEANGAAFVSVAELAAAMRRAASAHGEHEKRIGKHDTMGWPEWYAEYIVAEQAGKALPT